jgi:myosin heavy subunit
LLSSIVVTRGGPGGREPGFLCTLHENDIPAGSSFDIDEVRLQQQVIIEAHRRQLESTGLAFTLLQRENLILHQTVDRYKAQLCFIAEKMQHLERQNIKKEQEQMEQELQLQLEIQQLQAQLLEFQQQSGNARKRGGVDPALLRKEMDRRKELEDKLGGLRNEVQYCKQELERQTRAIKQEHQLNLATVKRQHKQEVDRLAKELEKERQECERMRTEMKRLKQQTDHQLKKAAIAETRPARSSLSQFVRPVTGNSNNSASQSVNEPAMTTEPGAANISPSSAAPQFSATSPASVLATLPSLTSTPLRLPSHFQFSGFHSSPFPTRSGGDDESDMRHATPFNTSNGAKQSPSVEENRGTGVSRKLQYG